MPPTRRTPGRAKASPPAKTGKAKRKAPAARPRIGRPPGKSGTETRAAIVAAARQRFVDVGFDGATNRSIAAEAGVTAAAIYQYFTSKTELYVAVVVETQEMLMPRLQAVADAAPSARSALSAILREHLLIDRNVVAARFLAGIPIEMRQHPEVAQAVVAQPGTIFDLVLEVVRRGVRTGEIASGKAEQVVASYVAAQIGLSIHAGTMPASHAQAAVHGFIELLEGTLFER